MTQPPVPPLGPEDVSASLVDQLYLNLVRRHEGRGRSLSSESGSPKKILGELGKIFRGDLGQVAAAIGVSRRTVERWQAGTSKPSKGSLAKLDATLPVRRRARIPAGREKWLRGKPFVGVMASTRNPSPHGKKGDDTRDRKFNAGPYLPRGALGPTIDAYLAGKPMTEVALVFAQTIEKEYGGVRIEEVERLVIAQHKPDYWEDL